ncbi:ArsA family ATPase [Planctomycetota bacterium]
MRVILYTGKGGVGKSTIAAATAVQTAAQGRKTLLVSSDLAHNLSDIFDVKAGAGCLEVVDNLSILEVDVVNEIRDNWDSFQKYLEGFLVYLGIDSVVAEETALIPGMDIVFLLLRILHEIESGKHDTIVVDCAPTGGTLRMLTLTDSAGSKLDKLVDWERKILKLIRPFAKRFKKIKALIPEDDFYQFFSDIIRDLGRLGDLLRDRETSSVRLVLNPDRIALAETRRAYTYFALFGYSVDAILVNKVFPEELSIGYLDPWCARQQQQMEVISKSFMDTKLLPVRYLDTEPTGVDQLRKLGSEIYGDTAPDDLLSQTDTVRFGKKDDFVTLTFTLPNLDKTELDIGQKGNELLINTGNYNRVFTLPDTLHQADIKSACFEDDDLVITFSQKNATE